MTKEIHAILPEYAYEIVMDIIKSQGLDKREELISEQLRNAKDPEIIKSLLDDKPVLVLAKIAKKAAIEKLSEQEITSLVAEKLRLDKERAELLMAELKKKLVFFIEVVEIDSEKNEKKEPSVKEEIGNIVEEEDEKENEKKEKKIGKENQDSDPYREPIE